MNKTNYPLYETDIVNNLKELVENCAAKYGDKVAFEYRGNGRGTQKVTYKQFKNDIECLGTAFYSIGLMNSHIAVLGENSYAWITTYLAATAGSNVIVPVDRELPAQEMKNILLGSNSRAIVYSEKYADVVEELAREIADLSCLINMQAPADNDNVKSYKMLLEKGRQLILQGDNSFINNPIENDEMAAIIYTSGTTGVSKGVMLSQKNMAVNVVAATQNAMVYDSSVLILPLHHTFGWTAGVLCMLHVGSKICINSSLKNVAKDILFYHPTQLCLVPLYVETMYKRIWENAEKQNKAGLLKMLIVISNALRKLGIDLRRTIFKTVLESFGGELRLIICGGATLDPKYERGFGDFGILILNGYGLTECAPIVTGNRNEYYRDDSIGLVLPGCEVKIDSPNPNGEGELWVKGPNVMLGYYNNPQGSADTMAGEWLKTGDVGKFDADGFLYVTGRIKNMIKLSNGLNIYPEELEMLIANIPFVKEVVVYAKSSQLDGEPELTAEVFLDQPYIEENSLKNPEQTLEKEIDIINNMLPYYKKISGIKIRATEFNKTTTQKIKRLTIIH